MPRKPINLTRCVVYVLKYNNIVYYVGSTNNLYLRTSLHKSLCKNTKCHTKLYTFMRENGGFDNWDLEIIQTYTDCKSLQELHWHEREYYDIINPELNTLKPCLSQDEKREYATIHHNLYRNKNLERMSKSHDCLCGGRFTQEQISTHKKSKRHQKYLECLPCVAQP